jgi:hypothetical protein
MTSELPPLSVLKAIAPSPDTKESPILQYDELTAQTDLHRPFEYERMDKFWMAETDSLEEMKYGKQLAMYYMLLGANALQSAGTEASMLLLSDRYTQLTGELYGRPDAVLAKRLWEQQISGEEQEVAPFQEASRQLGEYLNATYATVFDALELENAPDYIDTESIVERFDAGLIALANDHDESWSEWSVVRNKKGDILSVEGLKKNIVVGMRRADVSASQLKGLFAHEVLVHAQRAVNGAKIDDELRKGLSGYINIEEGLGVFVEYSITGSVPEKNIDRYVDIAYALGDIDGIMHTRAELVEHALSRAQLRNQQRLTGKSDDQIRSEVYTHVNRIYRGSRGDEYIGIYTKDIAYHKGFIDLGTYISDEYDATGDVATTFGYLLQGKFDPTNAAHVRYLQAATL